MEGLTEKQTEYYKGRIIFNSYIGRVESDIDIYREAKQMTDQQCELAPISIPEWAIGIADNEHATN